MRHLIPSLCLALLLAETACSAPQAAKRSDADARSKKAAVTRQHAASAYDELDNDTAPVSKKSTATASTAPANASAAASVSIDNTPKTNLDEAREVIQDYTQPIIVVTPAMSSKGEAQEIAVDNNSHSVQEAIHSYLTKKNYEVKSVEGQETLNEILQMQNDIANTEDDLSYLAGIALDADVYIFTGITFSGISFNSGEFFIVSNFLTKLL